MDVGRRRVKFRGQKGLLTERKKEMKKKKIMAVKGPVVENKEV